MTREYVSSARSMRLASVAVLLAAACTDGTGPQRGAPESTEFSHTGDHLVRMAGAGSIGTMPAAPGNDVRDFDLDVASTLSGRLFVRDWIVVRPDGSVGTLRVSPTDPATRFTAFRDSSARCGDPARGVEFEGIARVNSGGDSNPGADEMLAFIVRACDGGPVGSGEDYFQIAVPAHDYDRGDPLTSGDLVKSSSTGETGNLVVTTQTTGSDQPSGYTITVDGTQSQPIAASGSVTFAGLSAGSHSVAIGPPVPNCALVNTSNPQTVTVPAGGTATATFTVDCQPNRGTLTVTTSTSGSDLDPDGYTVRVDLGDPRAIPIDGSVTYTGLPAGSHNVLLTGVAGNCAVGGGASRMVEVPSGGTAAVSYAVVCAAPNQPPTVNAGPDETALIGLLYQLTWSFGDPDNGPWTYTIDWGDGSRSTGSTSSPGSFSRGHTYLVLLPRSFTIRVTVVDSNGASGSDTKVVSVLLL